MNSNYFMCPCNFHVRDSMKLILFYVLVLTNTCASTDPCIRTNANAISDWRRSTANEESGGYMLCDSTMTAGWYIINSGAGELMPTQCIDRFRCGTTNPVWLSPDNIPAGETVYPGVIGVIYNRTCYGVDRYGCKAKSYTIKIKKCPEYVAYYLRPTEGCDTAYCFGSEKPCPAGQSSRTGFTPNCSDDFPAFEVTPRVTVGFHTETTTKGQEVTIHKSPKFICDASDASDTYNYDVSFFVGDVKINLPDDGFRNVSMENIPNASLLQDHWENITRLNMLVKCAIAVRYKNYGVPGRKRYSKYYFAGIKILGGIEDSGFTLEEGETKNIQVQSTIPVGCSYTEGKKEDKIACFAVIHNGIPDYQSAENCVQSVKDGNLEFKPTKCRLKIMHDDWSRIYNITIQANQDNKANMQDRTVYLRLFATPQVSSTVRILSIWNNLVLKDIRASVL